MAQDPGGLKGLGGLGFRVEGSGFRGLGVLALGL